MNEISGIASYALQQPRELHDWMQCVYDQAGFKGSRIVVPALPCITNEQAAAFQRFGMRLFYIPAVSEYAYPDSFVKPAWGGGYFETEPVKRRQLPGKWIAVETIAKCDWNDPRGYGGGNDPVAAALKLTTRFKISWDDHHAENGTLQRLAKLGNFPKRGTRFGTAEEVNFIGNLFNHLRRSGAMLDLPDLGATDSWEWCENAYGSVGRVLVGRRDRGGLAAVHWGWHDDPHGLVGFRILVQF